MADEVFLRDWGLFKRYESQDYWYDGFQPSPINLLCENCGVERTFNPASETLLKIGNSDLKYIMYNCPVCKFKVTFILYEGCEYDEGVAHDPYIMKVCQWPSWSPRIDKRLQKLFGDNLDYYKKGLCCEQEDFGIGAFAYYRRIIEVVIDKLLDALYDMLNDEEKEKYKEDMNKARTERVAEKKIEIVKEILPTFLRPDGLNPLKSLHSSLSAGLHSGSEKECLEIAKEIRISLEFLLKGLVENREEKRDYSKAVKKLDQHRDKTKKNDTK
jgi:hypothetical protein